MFVLKVDAEFTGYNKTLLNINDLINEVLNELDEDILEITIKKRATIDSTVATIGSS